jgi:hypothetical protein
VVKLYASGGSKSHQKLQFREIRLDNHARIAMHTPRDLEAFTISKQIELERWGWVQSLHLFVFSQNLFYLLHFHASGDS